MELSFFSSSIRAWTIARNSPTLLVPFSKGPWWKSSFPVCRSTPRYSRRPGLPEQAASTTMLAGDRRVGGKQPVPAGNGFASMGAVLPLEGLLGGQAAGEGLVLCAGKPLHLPGAFLPTGENPGLAPFPDHVEFRFFSHHLSLISFAVESISVKTDGI